MLSRLVLSHTRNPTPHVTPSIFIPSSQILLSDFLPRLIYLELATLLVHANFLINHVQPCTLPFLKGHKHGKSHKKILPSVGRGPFLYILWIEVFKVQTLPPPRPLPPQWQSFRLPLSPTFNPIGTGMRNAVIRNEDLASHSIHAPRTHSVTLPRRWALSTHLTSQPLSDVTNND